MNFYLTPQDNVLSTMHGAKAFKDFIDKKNTRVPEFLEVVAEHQEPNKTDSEETTQDGRKKSRAVSIAKSQFGSNEYVYWVGRFFNNVRGRSRSEFTS